MVTSTEDPSFQPQDEVDLTDEQIQQLLLEAEGRLRGPLAQATKGTEDAVFKYVNAAVMIQTLCLRSRAHVSPGSRSYLLGLL